MNRIHTLYNVLLYPLKFLVTNSEVNPCIIFTKYLLSHSYVSVVEIYKENLCIEMYGHILSDK